MGVWVSLWQLGWVPIGVICDVLVVDGGMVDGFVVGSNWGRGGFFCKITPSLEQFLS